MVGKVLLEDMLLHISRLTDPPASGKDRDKGNLTIRNLPGFVEDATTRAALYRLVNKAWDKVEVILKLRIHRIAHCNLDLAINNEPTPLLEPAKEQVREALSAIRDVLTGLEQRYFGYRDCFYRKHNPTWGTRPIKCALLRNQRASQSGRTDSLSESNRGGLSGTGFDG